jgi:Lrp/AsnC family transcriptional regulator, leucine-responsive regulatory protein
MPRLDSLDERILSSLQSDGRLTMKALAEDIGMSSPAVIERVRRLEERGMLTGYRGLVDPAAIGRPLSVMLFATVPHAKREGFLATLTEHPAVEEVIRVGGLRNFIVRAHFSSTEELEELMDTLGDSCDTIESEMVLSSPMRSASIMPPPEVVSRRKRGLRRRQAGNEQ